MKYFVNYLDSGSPAKESPELFNTVGEKEDDKIGNFH